jgi:hypothetical protein
MWRFSRESRLEPQRLSGCLPQFAAGGAMMMNGG